MAEITRRVLDCDEDCEGERGDDRDVLLLHLVDMGDHLDHELATIKRMLDVFIKRAR